MWVYDPESNQWSSRAAMPTPRYGHATAALDGQLYLMGGRQFAESQPATAVELYTP